MIWTDNPVSDAERWKYEKPTHTITDQSALNAASISKAITVTGSAGK